MEPSPQGTGKGGEVRIQVEYWFPRTLEIREKKEIEIPDGSDAREYIENHESALVEREAGEDIDSGAFDLGYAGIRLLKDWK